MDSKIKGKKLIKVNAWRQCMRGLREFLVEDFGTPNQPLPPRKRQKLISEKKRAGKHDSSPAAKGQNRILAIVAAWREHHDISEGYNLSPISLSNMETKTKISRRTLNRVVNTMFGLRQNDGSDGWARYELQCETQHTFLSWLDGITNPESILRLLLRSPKSKGNYCDSCGDEAKKLHEYGGKEFCFECYEVSSGKK